MPARTDIKKIMIIGSGPIVIGQACEFDYSGVQAVKALKEEGYQVILVNPNPATVMTTPTIADAIYVEPLTPPYVEEIIVKEKPDALLSTMGGQTALNLSLELEALGILKKHNVEIIGASAESINKAEDRGEFKKVIEALRAGFTPVHRSPLPGRRPWNGRSSRLPPGYPTQFYPGRHGGRHRPGPERPGEDPGEGLSGKPHPRSAD